MTVDMLPTTTDQLLRDRVDTLVNERLEQLVTERVDRCRLLPSPERRVLTLATH